MDEPPTYDIHPEARAPAGTTLVLDDSDDSDDEDWRPQPDWGVKAECALSPRQLLAGCAVVASLYMLNCIVFYCLH